MNPHRESNIRMRGRWLTIARVTWVTLVVVTVTLFAAGLVAGLGQLRAMCTGDICRHPLQLSPEQAELNQQLGLSPDFYAWYTTIIWAAFGCVFFSVGVLIFWRRPNDPMALFVSLLLLMFGASIIPVIPAIQVIQPQLRWAQDFFLLISSGSLPVFLILFPDGRFVPSWTRWLVIAWLAWE